MDASDTIKPVVIVNGDTVKASNEIAADVQEHLRQRAALHGPVDACLVAEGTIVAGLRHLGEVEGHAALVDRLRHWLGQAEKFAALSSAPSGARLQ